MSSSSVDIEALLTHVDTASGNGNLLDSSAKNLREWIGGEFLPDWALMSVAELIQGEEWSELNDRFFKYIAFGTGGMRGRTVGRVSAKAEVGQLSDKGSPEHPAVGSATLNDFNLLRATAGLFQYCSRHLAENSDRCERPRLVIAHDVRHFSRHFCELVASAWTRLGGDAMIFDGPRSTPQLSFTVRYLGATAGIVITASHNPPHDNGFKVYFSDGAQVVSPHAEGIIDAVYATDFADLKPFLEKNLSGVHTLAASVDEAYMTALDESVIDPEAFRAADLDVVFTAIHGTGGVACVPALQRYGVNVLEVPEQAIQDPRFPTVKSPNPENAEALAMGIAKAADVGASLVLATDPDSDRMGVAVGKPDGGMELLSGNVTGSLLAEFRIRKLKETGALPPEGTKNAVLIKTFVTTRLQDAIGEKHGLKVINTLTGFKYLGEKLANYEGQLKAKLLDQAGIAMDYDASTPETRRKLMLEHSTFYVVGGEESYGYLGNDRVRDKDANAAALMFCEMAAALAKEGKTILEFLDEIFIEYGYYAESLLNIQYEGAAGAAKIKAILDSLREDPPKQIGGINVTKFTDFGRQMVHDADGAEIPKQDFYFFDLANGYSLAVRGSGTEPKIKFYFFAREPVEDAAGLAATKAAATAVLERLKAAVDADARQRAEG